VLEVKMLFMKLAFNSFLPHFISSLWEIDHVLS